MEDLLWDGQEAYLHTHQKCLLCVPPAEVGSLPQLRPSLSNNYLSHFYTIRGARASSDIFLFPEEATTYGLQRWQRENNGTPATSSRQQDRSLDAQNPESNAFSNTHLSSARNRGVPADVRDSHGNTILIVACQNGHKRALKAALRHGADPDASNARGNTALHYCYAFGG